MMKPRSRALPTMNSTTSVFSLSMTMSSLQTDFSNESLNEGDNNVDYTKDNADSYIDLERDIQSKRIIKILNESLYKIKLAICLPELAQDNELMKTILAPNIIEELKCVFEQCDSPQFYESMLNQAAVEDIKKGDIAINNRLNIDLSRVLTIMADYKELIPVVEDLIIKIRSLYCVQKKKNANENIIDPKMEASLQFLLTFERFRKQIMSQLNITAGKELGDKLMARKVANSNQKILAKIQAYTETIEKENEVYENRMAEKKMIIKNLEKKLASLKRDAILKTDKLMLGSDRQMVLASRSHEVKKEMMMEAEAEAKKAYTNAIQSNLSLEKTRRAQRLKIERLLQTWVQKYNADLLEKEQELTSKLKDYNEEKKILDILKEKMKEQKIKHQSLTEERAKKYNSEMAEKMTTFIKDHAARVIQIAWMTALANRAEKIKVKKMCRMKRRANTKNTKKGNSMKGRSKKN